VIDDLSKYHHGVLSTGGGSVLRPLNRQNLHSRGKVIYLRSTPEEVFRRLKHDMQRPLLQVSDPQEKLKDLFNARDPLYRETAHFTFETGRPSISKLLNTIKIVQGRLHPALEIEGMALTMYDTRLRLANQVVDEVKTHFQELVFDTVIHRNTTLSEASSHGNTVVMHDASSKGSINYLNFARELLQKNDLTKIGNDDKNIDIDHEL
jgi:hypothetical protein